MNTINLPLPYISQFDPANTDQVDDCGPSCVAMILQGLGKQVTTNEVFVAAGAQPNTLITYSQLQTAVASFGFTSQYHQGVTPFDLYNYLQQGITPIVLVHAGNLSSRQDQQFTGGHFLVVVGMRDDGYFVQDPDFWGQFEKDGDHHFYTKADFETAWSNCFQDQNPNNSALVINKPHSVQDDLNACLTQHTDLVDQVESYKKEVEALQQQVTTIQKAFDDYKSQHPITSNSTLVEPVLENGAAQVTPSDQAKVSPQVPPKGFLNKVIQWLLSL